MQQGRGGPALLRPRRRDGVPRVAGGDAHPERRARCHACAAHGDPFFPKACASSTWVLADIGVHVLWRISTLDTSLLCRKETGASQIAVSAQVWQMMSELPCNAAGWADVHDRADPLPRHNEGQVLARQVDVRDDRRQPVRAV